ncbi:sigma-70 family RNA polymerase sigma factor [Corynebacterium pseudopelargi]|uniref:ECF RNA polymerase sigma factor SigD n=1 Tax=Corynebacterium pseudopelargi TaxID=2080757 RepID=A0A3G6IVW6_9CORY|nr:sigma-70 family RNA polymerase sigma factor [Corynebacterium pseudopelargi]AZA09925.1 ECF RNA polymerase sigma factor SigD [Corynebacterium pseudopelargi]
MSDEDELQRLVPKAQAGDAVALERIIEISYPVVLRYARARMSGGRHPTPEDVAQETCLALANSIERYVDRGRPFLAFVYGIASNKVADAMRYYKRDLAHPTDEVPDTEIVHDTPEHLTMAQAGSNRMLALLDVLSDKAREVVILRVFNGLSADETAEILGSTPGAVRVAQHRALATLRKALEQERGNE